MQHPSSARGDVAPDAGLHIKPNHLGRSTKQVARKQQRLRNAKYEPSFPKRSGEATCVLETVFEDSHEAATDAGIDEASLSFFSEAEDVVDDASSTLAITNDFEGVWSKAYIDGETLTWNEGEIVAITRESLRKLRMHYLDKEYVGEVQDDGALHWDNGDIWFRSDPWSAPDAGKNNCAELGTDGKLYWDDGDMWSRRIPADKAKM